MSKNYTEVFKDSRLLRGIIDRIIRNSKKEIRIMEVCGTHTVCIFRSGLRSLLPSTVKLCSGPGCPVCVTAQNEIDAFIMLAKCRNVIVATFGDLVRVPGTVSTLQQESATGADVRVVYSTFDALDIAKENPNKKVVFLGIGFETTAPTVAAVIVLAKQMGIKNFYVVSAHKIVPPALEALANNEEVNIDGFILPGHVSVIIGMEAYEFFLNKYKIPCVVGGFENIDLLRAISMLVDQVESGIPKLENGYARAVRSNGNLRAKELLDEVFEVVDTEWRGIGMIPKSGLALKDEYSMFDAQRIFDIKYEKTSSPKGCACGDILLGIKTPPQCKLYKKACTPANPVGPCMVSSEGTCAAYYRYNNDVLNY